MTREDFINTLRRSISGVNDYQFVSDTIEYYQNYIETEIRKGSTEKEVLDSLGDPRLIAKSILASRGFDSAESNYEENQPASSDESVHITTRRGRSFDLPRWLVKAGSIAIGIGAIVLVGFVAVKLLPVICVLVLVGLIYKFIKENL